MAERGGGAVREHSTIGEVVESDHNVVSLMQKRFGVYAPDPPLHHETTSVNKSTVIACLW